MFNIKKMDLKKVQHAGKALAAVVAALGLVVITTCASNAASFAQKHPRRAQVLRRDRGLNREVKADRGSLGGHYGQLNREDASIARQEQHDARMNGGYITKGEQNQLNREENHVQGQINRDNRIASFDRNHPRRAEVLRRDSRLNNKINRDRGDLGGNYGALKSDDASIRQQEQSDAKANGGYITPLQQQQLNQEENQLTKQIRQDDRL